MSHYTLSVFLCLLLVQVGIRSYAQAQAGSSDAKTSVLPGQFAGVDCSQEPGGDTGVKINKCIVDAQSSSGIADGTKFAGLNQYSTGITCKQGVSLYLGAVTLSYIGTGVALDCESPATATPSTKSTNAYVFGSGVQNTIIQIDPSFRNSEVEAVAKIKWTVDVGLSNLTLATNGKARYGLERVQDFQTKLTNVRIQGDGSNGIGSYDPSHGGSLDMIGSGYGTIINIEVNGGSIADVRGRSTTIAPPPAIQTALGLGGSDGLDYKYDRFYGGQFIQGFKSALRLECVSSSVTPAGVHYIQFDGTQFNTSGLKNDGTGDESGAYLFCDTSANPSGDIADLKVNATAQGNRMHGFRISGNVTRGEFHINSKDNGIGVNGGHAMLWEDLNSIGPTNNLFYGVLSYRPDVGTNKALVTSTNSNRNGGLISTGDPMTIVNKNNPLFQLNASTGQLVFLGSNIGAPGTLSLSSVLFPTNSSTNVVRITPPDDANPTQALLYGTPSNNSGANWIITKAGQYQTYIGSGTPPLFVSSARAPGVDPVANFTASSHPIEYNCGTTSTCAHTLETLTKIVRGTASLTSGVPSTITVTSLPFSGDASYNCTVTNQTTQANPLKVINVSRSSITIIGPNAVRDKVSYLCIGT